MFQKGKRKNYFLMFCFNLVFFGPLYGFGGTDEVKSNRKYANTLFFLAKGKFLKEKYVDAIHYYKLGLIHDPYNTKMRYQLSIALGKSGDLRGAVKELVEVVRQDPFYNDAKRRLKQYKHLDYFITEDHDVTRNYLDLKEPVEKMEAVETKEFAAIPKREETNLYYIISNSEDVEVLKGEDGGIPDAPSNSLFVTGEPKIGIIADPSGAPASARLPVGIEREKTPEEKIQEIIDGGEFVEALEKLIELEKINPGTKEISWMKGQIFHRQGDYPQAEKELKKACDLDQTNNVYRFLLAKTQFKWGSYREARKNFEKILSSDPGNLYAAMDLAQMDLLDGNYKAARKVYENLLQKDPGLTEVILAMGEIEILQGNYEEGEKLALKILEEKDPKNYFAMNLLGQVYLEKGENEKAVVQFDKALTSQSFFPLAHYHKGRAYLKMANADKAIESFKKCFEQDPSHILNIYKYLQTLTVLRRGDEARVILASVTPNFPGHHRLFAIEGLILKSEKNYLLSLQNFQKANALSKVTPEYWFELGDCYLNLKDYEQTISTAQKALSLFPNYKNKFEFENLIFSAKAGQTQDQKTTQDLGKLAPSSGARPSGSLY